MQPHHLGAARRPPLPAAGGFRANAWLSSLAEYERLYRRSLDEPDAFWSEAADELHWFDRWRTVMEWNEPHTRWFVGGTTNLAYNCLDLQVEKGLANKVGPVLGGRARRPAGSPRRLWPTAWWTSKRR